MDGRPRSVAGARDEAARELRLGLCAHGDARGSNVICVGAEVDCGPIRAAESALP